MPSQLDVIDSYEARIATLEAENAALREANARLKSELERYYDADPRRTRP